MFMENLILICNNFANEKCLELLGQIITEKNNTLKTLVLSKNFISTPPDQAQNQNTTSTASTTPNPDQKKTAPSVPVAPAPQVSPATEVKEKTDYFKNFMKSLSNSENLEELFLISCGIGKNMDDVDTIYDMLSKNKSLISLRLFGNSFFIFSIKITLSIPSGYPLKYSPSLLILFRSNNIIIVLISYLLRSNK